jgi:hypothetical protein
VRERRFGFHQLLSLQAFLPAKHDAISDGSLFTLPPMISAAHDWDFRSEHALEKQFGAFESSE